MFGRASFWFIYCLTAGMTVFLIGQLYTQVETGILIPVGIVDLDQSKFSEYVLEALEDSTLVETMYLGEDNIRRNLVDHKVEAVYVIHEGAQKNVEKGKLDDLFDVYYLDGNYFTMMLTDIISGDFLDEICLITASRYYLDGYKKYINENTDQNIYNTSVYKNGKHLDLTQRSNYYIDIHIEDEANHELTWYNQSIVLEKMTVGIIFVFIGFFMLFEGISIVKERKQESYLKLHLSGLTVGMKNLVESIALFIAGLSIGLPMLALIGFFTSNLVYYSLIILLFILSLSQLIRLFICWFKSYYGYVIIGTSLIIGSGIVSGSFFTIDLSNPIIDTVARLFPFYYSVNAYFDKTTIKEYIVYTILYSSTLYLLNYGLDRMEKPFRCQGRY